jgi:hypothetical protein
MPEMIDKWGVVNKLIALENEFQHYKPFHGFEHPMYRKVCEAEIEIGKTSGVVMVFCKDCAFSCYNSSNETYKCRAVNGMYRRVEPNEFCSYGERYEE